MNRGLRREYAEGTCWELAGERMDAESSLKGGAGKSLRDLGEEEERSGADIRRRNRVSGGAEKLRKGLEATCGPPHNDLVTVL